MTNFLEKELPTGKGEAAVAKSLDGVLLPEDPKDVLIRELQAELAELKLQHIASVSQAIELQAENAKLKAERRIFGLLVARKVWDAAKDHATKVQVFGEINVPSVCLAEYVEQELNK